MVCKGFAKRATADRHKMGAVAIALAALGRAGNVYNECKRLVVTMTTITTVREGELRAAG